MAKGFGGKGHEGKGHDAKYNNAKDNDEKGKEDPSDESTDNKNNKSQDKGDAEDSKPDNGKGKEKESTSEQPKDNKNKDNQDEGKPKLDDKVLPPEKTSKYKDDKSKSCSQWEAFKHRFKYGGTGYECSPENDDSSSDEEEKARDKATKENTRKNNGRPKPEPPKDHENEPEDNENDTERPKEKKGEPKAKCVRWADYEQFASFLDNVPRTGRYDHKKVLLEHRKKKEQKKLQHLKCAADETRAALDGMEGKDSETTNDDETERIIDGDEGEGEGEGEGERSTIYNKIKRLKELEEGIIDLKDRWKVQDPKLRDKMREQAVEELGTLNHKLSTGDWIQEMNEGKPYSLMEIITMMDELKENIKLIDRF